MEEQVETEPRDRAATTRARILQAALDVFAEEGFDAGLRAIAARAGVTAGLITHYFGSKTQLRIECDDFIIERVVQGLPDLFDIGKMDVQFTTDAGAVMRSMRYSMRGLSEGGPLADRILAVTIEHVLQTITAGVEKGLVEPSEDEAERARVVVRYSVGAAMLDFALDPPKSPDEVRDGLAHYWRNVVRPMIRVTGGRHFVSSPNHGGLLGRSAFEAPRAQHGNQPELA
ncbi:TetR family transcriptional regulator [Ruania alkalisoli]|uniref:TetR family transcriptional regulator n=1 Tax=Ruania alkalisoli TaxID=2779775 RepID=A0A7M1SW61_9MICO|nr:TetR family transcriptional regulator [Ruania alkalisoli]QOR71297.1 TetR family transcriptional regulator [Ruania alkalisoli]